MRDALSSRIMPRTTIDIDATVLEELKERQRVEGKTLGQLASELLAGALAGSRPERPLEPLAWTAQRMGARIDLEDKDVLHAALDER
jgi:hypothetical protein